MKVDIGRGLAKSDTTPQKNTLPAYRSQGSDYLINSVYNPFFTVCG